MLKFIKNIFKKIIKFFSSVRLDDAEDVVHYIFTAESLPEPLDIEREAFLVQAYQEKADKRAKSELIEHNLRLVMYIAKRFESNKLDLADLVSVGSIGLIKAVDSYKLDKNIKLATYASRCIENEILMYLRKVNKTLNDLSLDESMENVEDGSGLSLGELIPDDKCPTDAVELEAEKNALRNCLDLLNEREKRIMYMRYGLNGYEELTQKEVADKMNISQSYISRLEKKILHKLKRDMSRNL